MKDTWPFFTGSAIAIVLNIFYTKHVEVIYVFSLLAIVLALTRIIYLIEKK